MHRFARIACALAVMAPALALGPRPAMAAHAPVPVPARVGQCLGHSVSLTLGGQIEVLTHLENECGQQGSLTIGYRADGPCRHAVAVTVVVPMHPVDVVAFYDWPCPGHYLLHQDLAFDGRWVGQDNQEFDSPGG